jgi:hypothetical protein
MDQKLLEPGAYTRAGVWRPIVLCWSDLYMTVCLISFRCILDRSSDCDYIAEVLCTL